MPASCCNRRIYRTSVSKQVGSDSEREAQKTDFILVGFTTKQVQRLYSRFKTLDKRDCGFLTREDLMCIPEVRSDRSLALEIASLLGEYQSVG